MMTSFIVKERSGTIRHFKLSVSIFLETRVNRCDRYSRGNILLQASHLFRNVYWDLLDMKSLVATLQPTETTIMRVSNVYPWRSA